MRTWRSATRATLRRSPFFMPFFDFSTMSS